MKEKSYILVLNAGSSSLKFSLFNIDKNKLGNLFAEGKITRKQAGCDLAHNLGGKEKKFHLSDSFSIKMAWTYFHDLLSKINIIYVGFRVVHGGGQFNKTVKIDKNVLASLAKFNDLAPLHNPPALELIKLVQHTWPRLKMAASFDTAWYKDLKPEVYLYAIPLKYYKELQIRKYGFHGLSHEMAVEQAAAKLKKAINKVEIISCHLGSGSSISWFDRGQVRDTSMGFTANEGLVMSTRSGDLPPDVAFYLMDQAKLSASKIKDILYNESGLVGLCGTYDLREILLANGYRIAGFRSSWKYTASQKERAKLALAKYLASIKKYLGSYLAQAKHLDAIVFAGAAGADSPIIRKLILSGLNVPKYTKIILASGDENINIAQKTLTCLH